MLKYLVVDITTRQSQTVETCDDAARIAQLNSEELELEIDQHGVCETDQYTIVEILCATPDDWLFCCPISGLNS
jgi:hypothetical protein